MSNHSRNFMRRRTMNRNVRMGGRLSRRQHQTQAGNDDDAFATFDAARFMPRPVTKSKNTVIFDLHGGVYTYFHIMVALEQQFNSTDILVVSPMDGSNYCQPNCILAEVLFATSEARRLAITRGIIVDGVRFLAVPVVGEISYKDVYRFQNPQQTPLNWPNGISEVNTYSTVFMIDNLPLEKINVMIGKVTTSLESSSSSEQRDHPLITVFGKPHILSPLLKNVVYVVVHGHVDSYSAFKQTNDEGQGTVHLDAYNSYQGFDFLRFKFDRAFCFNCDQPDCHFTENCNENRIAQLLRSQII